MVKSRRVLLALAVACPLLSGCAGTTPGGDKAGGQRSGGPLVLRMASTPHALSDVPGVADFVRQVSVLSRGTVRIEVINNWDGYASDAEARVVQAVSAGTVDLGWAGSRVFDSIGVQSLQALSAPMLIDSYPLETALLRSAIPGRMLPALEQLGVTGLAVLGDGLRFPIGVHGPLLTPADWRGVSFGTYRSLVEEEAIRALGATPVRAFGPFRAQALDTHRIQAFEFDLRRYEGQGLVIRAPYVAANVPLWPQIDVLFANPDRLGSLTAQQRAWLRQAAADAARHSVALVSDNPAYVRADCGQGARFAKATPADLTALRRSLSGVYRKLLAHDPHTNAFIQQIEALKRSTRPGPGVQVPAGCGWQR